MLPIIDPKILGNQLDPSQGPVDENGNPIGGVRPPAALHSAGSAPTNPTNPADALGTLDFYMHRAGVPDWLRQSLTAPAHLQSGIEQTVGGIAGGAGKMLAGLPAAALGASGLVPSLSDQPGDMASSGFNDIASAFSGESTKPTGAPAPPVEPPGQEKSTKQQADNPAALLNQSPPQDEQHPGTLYFEGALLGRGEDASGPATGHGWRAMDPGQGVRDLGPNEPGPSTGGTGGFVSSSGPDSYVAMEQTKDLNAQSQADSAAYGASLNRLRLTNPAAYNEIQAGQLRMKKEAEAKPELDKSEQTSQRIQSKYERAMQVAAGQADPQIKSQMEDKARKERDDEVRNVATITSGYLGRTPVKQDPY